jgi:hypothetical protein
MWTFPSSSIPHHHYDVECLYVVGIGTLIRIDGKWYIVGSPPRETSQRLSSLDLPFPNPYSAANARGSKNEYYRYEI